MKLGLKFLVQLTAISVFLGLMSAFVAMKVGIRGGEETMPNLEGKPVMLATSELHQKGLALKVDDQQYSTAQPNDAVLRQDIPAGSRIKRGRTVHVVVSLGSAQVVAPEVVGMSLRQALILMQQNGLESGSVDRIYAPDAAETILAQTPDPGAALSHGSPISLLVSDGPQPERYVMPDLLGRGLEVAQAAVNQMGIFIKGVTQVEDARAAGAVLAQSIPPHSMVEKGADLTLSVAKGGEAGSRARFVLLTYQVPAEGFSEKRVRITVFDDMGTHVVHNDMEKPGAKISIPITARGKAHYKVTLSGTDISDTEIP